MDKKKYALAVVPASFMAAVPVFAESASGTANSSVVSAMTSVANDMVATGNAVIPVALTVVGLALVIVFGIRMFKKIAK